VLLSELVSCPTHAKKFWVICSVEAEGVDEAFLFRIVHENALKDYPYFVGRCAHVAEALVIYKCLEKDRHRVKTLKVDGRVSCLGLSAGGKSFAKMTKTLEQAAAAAACDIAIATMEIRELKRDGGDDVTLEEAHALTEQLSSTEFAAAVGNARLVDAAERSKLQRVLVRCEAQLRAMRSRAERSRALIMEVGTLSPAPISLRDFVGLDMLVGEGLDPVTGMGFSVSFTRFLKAVLLGRAGLGKTPLAKSFCAYAAVAYQGLNYDTVRDKCYFLMGNTVDMLKEFNSGGVWRPWTPLFLDEFDASDTRQQGILGENSMKVLTDPLAGGSIRCRYHDVVVPPNCPRVFASNQSDASAWLAHLGVDETHSAAIRKRCPFFRVRSNLLPVALHGSQQDGGIEVTAAMTQALEAAMNGM
jgi:hypothetical protein